MAEGTLVVPVWETENWKSIRKFVSDHGLSIVVSKSFSESFEWDSDIKELIRDHGVEMLQRARDYGNSRGMNLGIAYPSGDMGLFYLDVHYYKL